MKRSAILLTACLLLAPALSPARSAELSARAPAAAPLEHVRATLLGSAIYDEHLERIGVIHDIVATDRSQLYAIVCADDALRSDLLDLKVPVRELQSRGGLLVLPFSAGVSPRHVAAQTLRSARRAPHSRR